MCDVMAFDPGGYVYKSGKKKGQERPAHDKKARTDYVLDIVAEILTGEPKANARAKPLDWGHDVEAAARAAYEAETGQIVSLSEFVTHPMLPYVGCSPDGLVGNDGMVQIKCPADTGVHCATLEGGMPEEHHEQIQCELWVTGREWSDFVSYDPRMLNPALRLYRQRIKRDEEQIAAYAKASESLWAEVQRRISYLTTWAAAA
jgi:hypothetical protein